MKKKRNAKDRECKERKKKIKNKAKKKKTGRRTILEKQTQLVKKLEKKRKIMAKEN